MLNRTLTEEQIRDMWNNRAWQGKSTGDPFIVRGGYRCRHTWIPTDPAWGEETVDELPTEEELPPPTPPRGTVSDVSIGFLLDKGLKRKPSKARIKAYDEDFNSQLTDQQKIIVEKLRKPNTVRNTKSGYYVTSTGQLNAQLNAQNGRFTPVKSYVISHEYGHHIDWVAGGKGEFWSFRSKNFNDAIKKDKENFKGKYVGNEYQIDELEYKKMFNKLAFTEERKIYSQKNPELLISFDEATTLKGDGFGEVSDIFDALTKGKFRRNYKMWGHTVEYWNKYKDSVPTEIFANLFAIRHDKKAYGIAKGFIPNTVKEFENFLNQVENLKL
tara:strand:- start:276 stop:1259 length:984 start_codon:yes stop_codon:yes gene_type:complete